MNLSLSNNLGLRHMTVCIMLAIVLFCSFVIAYKERIPTNFFDVNDNPNNWTMVVLISFELRLLF